jgi:hypothetical protein
MQLSGLAVPDGARCTLLGQRLNIKARNGAAAKRALRTEAQWSLRVGMNRTQSIQDRNHAFRQKNAGVCVYMPQADDHAGSEG